MIEHKTKIQLILLFVLIFVACEKQSDTEKTITDQKSTRAGDYSAQALIQSDQQSIETTAIPTSWMLYRQPGQIPSSLINMKQSAENIFQRFPELSWTSAKAESTKIKTYWHSFQAKTRILNIPHQFTYGIRDAIQNLEIGVADRSLIRTLQATHDLIGFIIEFFDLFESEFPTDIYRLANLQRQIIIDSTFYIRGGIGYAIDRSIYLWQRISYYAEDKGTLKIARELPENLKHMQTALYFKSYSELTFYAQRNIYLISQLEKLLGK